MNMLRDLPAPAPDSLVAFFMSANVCCINSTSMALPIAANDFFLSSWVSFSMPSASTTSYMPDATYSHAR